MKTKRSFTVLIILACFVSCLFTCKHFDGEEAEYEYTDVVYSEDGNSVTIYLDGQVSVPRSLNNGIAKMGCDYFEVTFMYNNSGTGYIVARGEWWAGKMANISGIYRAGTVDYGGVTATPGAGSGSAILFAGKSDKTLMAIGRLTGVDGVGTQASRVTTISASTKSVTFTISAVTAGVKAVATGATTDGKTPASATGSSFVTNAGNTALDPDASRTTVLLNNRVFGTNTTVSFPIFKLTRDETKATYTFALSNPTGDYSIGAYANAIFISTPAFGNSIPGLPPVPPNNVPAEIEKKQPRYTTYNSRGEPIDQYHNSVLMLDEKTVVKLTNNNVPNDPFNPAVGFAFFNEDTIDGTVFSLVFSIPVYALQEYESYDSGVGIGSKSRWYIRSGYGPSLYDLDDGTSGMGGAVLIGTGDVNKEASGERTIRIPGQELENGGINGLPNKWQYTATVDQFNIDGLVVQLVGVETNNPTVYIENINYNDLTFKIGKGDSNGRHPKWTHDPGLEYTDPPSENTPVPWYIFPQEFFGIIEIIVEYHDNERDKIYQTSFYVLVGNSDHPFQSNFTIAHLYDINRIYPPTKPTTGTFSAWDETHCTYRPSLSDFENANAKFSNLLTIANLIQNRTVIIILHHSFDKISDVTLNSTISAFANFIVIAADDDRDLTNNTPQDIIFGRASSARIIHSGGVSPGLNAWYFGKWPFKGTPNDLHWPEFPYDFAGTIPTTNRTKAFTVNSGGGFWNVGGTAPPLPSDWQNPTTSWKMLIDSNQQAAAYVPGGGIYNVKVNGAVIRPTVIDSSGIPHYPLLH